MTEDQKAFQCSCCPGADSDEEILVRVSKAWWDHLTAILEQWQDANEQINTVGIEEARMITDSSGLNLLALEEELLAEVAEAAERLVESAAPEAAREGGTA